MSSALARSAYKAIRDKTNLLILFGNTGSMDWSGKLFQQIFRSSKTVRSLKMRILSTGNLNAICPCFKFWSPCSKNRDTISNTGIFKSNRYKLHIQNAEVRKKVWKVTFMNYELGYFNYESYKFTPLEYPPKKRNRFQIKV